MGLMDKMMDRMIGKMSPEEKEKMMLQMMPMMMKDVSMTEVMVKIALPPKRLPLFKLEPSIV